MNALDPIRHAYGEAEGTPPATGEPGHAEYRLLRSTRDVLDALPRERPDAAVLDAVKAAAAAYARQPLLAAYGEAAPPAADDPRHAEYALLQGTRVVLDRMPKPRPDPPVLDAVEAAAREAALAPLRHAYGEAEGTPPAPGEPGYAEYELLRSTRAALDALPRVRPDASVLDAVKAAAKARALRPVMAAYGEAEAPAAGDLQHAEYALLQSTREVLSRAPKARPDAAVVAAISAAAAGATAVPVAPARPAARPPAPGGPRPAADRPARGRVLPFGRLPAWVGTAAMLVIIATAGIWGLNERPTRTPSPEPSAQVAPVPEAEEQASSDPAAPRSPAPGEDLVAQAAPPTSGPPPGPMAAEGRARGAAPPPPAAPAPRPQARAPQESAAALAARAAEPSLHDTASAGRGADEEGMPVAAWEAGADVRLLSLRLQQLAETSEGLSWDAPPIPFGAAGALAGERLEGVQAVGAGPAHIEVRMRTTPADRSNGQQPRQ